LAAEGRTFNLIFIDGSHHYDSVMVDFTLAAELCPIGAQIVFDDLWWPSIRAVANWIRTNRSDFKFLQAPEGWAHVQRVAQDSREVKHFVDFSSRRTLRTRIEHRVKRAISSVKSA
jgi:hypothetical protein